MSSADDTLEHRVATVGQALPDTEVKIVAPWNDDASSKSASAASSAPAATWS